MKNVFYSDTPLLVKNTPASYLFLGNNVSILLLPKMSLVEILIFLHLYVYDDELSVFMHKLKVFNNVCENVPIAQQ